MYNFEKGFWFDVLIYLVICIFLGFLLKGFNIILDKRYEKNKEREKNKQVILDNDIDFHKLIILQILLSTSICIGLFFLNYFTLKNGISLIPILFPLSFFIGDYLGSKKSKKIKRECKR